MASTDHDIRVLNSLTETVLDSVNGYEEAIKDAGQASYASIFTQGASERRQLAETLRSQVRTLGGDPEDDGSALAAAHRFFLDIKDKLTTGDKSVVDEVERGEDFIKDKFQRALDDNELSGPSRDVVLRAYDVVKAGHDRVSQLKHGLEGAA